MFKIPKNTKEIVWTNHSIKKMKQYNLSEQRIKRVLNSPKRIEEGIAENTIAVMQIANPLSKKQTEIWVMIQKINSKEKNNSIKFNKLRMNRMRIISTWRYPGKSPVGKVPEIPEDVWDILEN